jgi:nucleoside-diphosphate-sugar epimerase
MSGVLVTGATGFVGLPLLTRLAHSEPDVHAVSRGESFPSVAGVTWHRLDLADGAGLETLMNDLRPERLVHTAWYVEHGRFWGAPQNVAWVERSLHLLRAFADAGGRRAVLLGTCAEYDWTAANGPLHEQRSPIEPRTLYGVAKDSLRRLACAYAERVGLELAWGRLFFLYGPREAPERLVGSVTRALLRGEPAKTTSGVQERDFLHVEDVAEATLQLLRGQVVGAVNIASGERVSMAALVDGIANAIGRPELVRRGVLPDRAGDPPLLLADVARLRKEVGFRPQICLEDGLRDTIEWWRSQGSDAIELR